MPDGSILSEGTGAWEPGELNAALIVVDDAVRTCGNGYDADVVLLTLGLL